MPNKKNVPEHVHADTTVHDESGSHVHADTTVHDESGSHVHADTTVHDESGNHVHADGTVHDESGNHVHADGTVHDEFGNHVHLDGATCGHAHTHDPDHPHIHTNKKAVLSRLARADGHLQSVMRMIDDNRDCSEVLIQLAAVRSAINNAGKVILRDHINECVTEAVLRGDTQELEELNKAIDQFVK